MERTTRSVHLLRSIYLIFTLYLIHTSIVAADSKDEYLLIDDDFPSSSSDFVSFRYLTKRDTPDDKKASYKEKKVKPKTSLPLTTVPTTVDEKAKVTTVEGPTLATPLKSTTLEDLPYDVPSNFSNTTTDHHLFYNSTIYGEDENHVNNFWVNLDDVKPHQMLSYSHRRAATLTLSFDFPFYGYMIRNITIATGGFLYTGDYMHTWLAATQYIAPLMANFDTTIHNDSTIKYKDDGSKFTVQWEDVYLKDKNGDGPFTFQVTLSKNGDITFVYKSVPVPVPLLDDTMHPVKVGLSDAYIINRVMLFIRRKTIYEYHRVNMKSDLINNNTAIRFVALPTCLGINTCDSCMNSNLTFDCVWCAEAGRCSNGLDRNRQHWLDNSCHDLKPSDVKCNATVVVPSPSPSPEPSEVPTKSTVPEKKAISSTTPLPTNASYSSTTATPVDLPVTEESASIHHIPSSLPPKVVTLPNDPQDPARINSLKPEPRVSDDLKDEANPASVGAGAVVSILLIVIVVTGFAVWIIYAYKFPQSPSGQLLIRYRPSQWRWRHGEARYTAASIHI